MPGKKVGILVLWKDLRLVFAEDPAYRIVPRDESKVGICAKIVLAGTHHQNARAWMRNVVFHEQASKQEKHSRFVPDQVLLPGQDSIEDTNDSDELFIISLLRTLDLLRMEVAEPSSLTEVRPLARHLEVQVLLGVVLLGEGGVADLVVLVVCVHQVLKDSTRLPQGDAGVRVFNGRGATIGVDLSVGLALDIGHETLCLSVLDCL